MIHPRRKRSTAHTGMERRGSTPYRVYSQKEVNMPIMRKSAWAKLTMFITPQIRVRPTAIREYMKPMSRPFMSCASSCSDMVGPSRNVGGGGIPPATPPRETLLPRFPGGERPDHICGGRFERPHGDVILVLDLHEDPPRVDVLVALR